MDKVFTPNGGSVPITEPAQKIDIKDITAGCELDAPKIFKPPTPQGGQVKAWSFSTLAKFESCKYAVFLSKVKKIRQESGEAADRGTRLHTAIEDYIRGETDTLLKEIKFFRSLIDDLRTEYKDKKAIVEDDWAFDIDWVGTKWMAKNVWCRIKLDAMRLESQTSGTVIDWKSGKKFGNEYKHAQQGQLYAIGAFLQYPKLEHVKVEFAYIDQGETLEKAYTRDEALMFLSGWTKRGTKMTSCQSFPPSPSLHNCRWCYYKEEHCEWAIQ